MWIYRKVLREFEVGYYRHDGEFDVIEVYSSQEMTANRVHYLNGGSLGEWSH